MRHGGSRRAHRRDITRVRRLLSATLGLVVGAILVAVDVAPQAGAAPKSTLWLCSPVITSDPCDLPQDTTDLLTGRVTNPKPIKEADKPVDCFFLYGTATNQVSLNADLVAAPEIQAAARLEAARFNRTCRIFAPVYRQVAWAGAPLVNLGYYAPVEVAYRDVLRAWNDYLTHANKGRGVIFIGHSQATYLLRSLIREQVDPRPAVRERVVGGFLMGGNVTTARGSAVGGDFAHIPVCTRKGEFGCITAYSTNVLYPPVSLFGNSSLDLTSWASHLPNGPQYEVACTDPAVLSGNNKPVGVTVPSEPYPPGVISSLMAYTAFPEAWPTSSSTFTVSRGRGVGSCEDVNGYRQYHIRMIQPQQINELPLFDSHVIDVNFGLDRLVGIADQQARGWLGDH